jgi:predicted transcriptional regulator
VVAIAAGPGGERYFSTGGQVTGDTQGFAKAEKAIKMGCKAARVGLLLFGRQFTAQFAVMDSELA